MIARREIRHGEGTVIDARPVTFVLDERLGNLAGVVGEVIQTIEQVLEIGGGIGGWEFLDDKSSRR